MLNIRIPFVIVAALFFSECQTGQRNSITGNSTIKTTKHDMPQTGNASAISEGYQLMKQKCFICHLETPDPAKKDQMLAPPMVRVQQHYKPAFPAKDDFIDAVMAYVKNPSEENTLMPGAVKRFKVMPKLTYEDKELQLIAGALYKTDFNSSPNMNSSMQQAKMQLDNGKKWKLNEKE